MLVFNRTGHFWIDPNVTNILPLVGLKPLTTGAGAYDRMPKQITVRLSTCLYFTVSVFQSAYNCFCISLSFTASVCFQCFHISLFLYVSLFISGPLLLPHMAFSGLV